MPVSTSDITKRYKNDGTLLGGDSNSLTTSTVSGAAGSQVSGGSTLLTPDWQPLTNLTASTPGSIKPGDPGWIDTPKANDQQNQQINDLNQSANSLIDIGKAQLTADQQNSQDLINTLTGAVNGQIGDIAGSVSDLQGQLSGSAGSLLDQQKQLLEAQTAATQQAADTAAAIFAERNKALQSVKKPNYYEIMKDQRARNSGGLSSTFLTGPAGVSLGDMALGTPTLLGA